MVVVENVCVKLSKARHVAIKDHLRTPPQGLAATVVIEVVAVQNEGIRWGRSHTANLVCRGH